MGRGLLLRRYRTSRGHLSRRAPRSSPTNAVLAILSDCCPPPKGRLSTCYSPVRRCTRGANPSFSLDLHVLGLPLTFALSQDQTLHLYFVDDVSSDFIPTRCSLPEGEAQPGQGLPVGIKPITLLAIQFSKTDRSLARAEHSSYFDFSVNPGASFVFPGSPSPSIRARRGSRFLPQSSGKGRSFSAFFRLWFPALMK
jgi:hypothetical protein